MSRSKTYRVTHNLPRDPWHIAILIALLAPVRWALTRWDPNWSPSVSLTRDFKSPFIEGVEAGLRSDYRTPFKEELIRTMRGEHVDNDFQERVKKDV